MLWFAHIQKKDKYALILKISKQITKYSKNNGHICKTSVCINIPIPVKDSSSNILYYMKNKIYFKLRFHNFIYGVVIINRLRNIDYIKQTKTSTSSCRLVVKINILVNDSIVSSVTVIVNRNKRQ